jgi:hypothetical protein
MRYLDVIGGLALYPDKYVRIIVHEERPLVESLLTVLFFQSMYSILFTTVIYNIVSSFAGFFAGSWVKNVLALFLPVMVPIFIVSGLLAWIIWSIVTHFMAKLFGGAGEYIQLLRVMGLSWFTIIISIIPLFFYPLSPIAVIVASILFSLITFGWYLYINYHGVKEIYGIGSGEALLSLLMLPLIFILLTFVLSFTTIFFTPFWW